MKRLKKLYNICIDIVCGFMDDYVSVYAAQASFFIIISAIPFIMLMLSLLHYVIQIDITALDAMIIKNVPSSLQETLLKIVSELFSKSSSASVISITAVSALWLSSRGVLALYQGLSTVYHADMRNYFYCRAMSIFYTVIFIVALVLTAVVFAFGGTIQVAILQRAPFLSGVVDFVLRCRIVIFMTLLTLCFALFYRFLPRCKPHLNFIRQIPGAVGAALCWMGFSYAYSLYIENFSNYSYVYGSLTAIIFLMLWLYFCITIFLFGAQLNKMLEAGFFKKLREKYKNFKVD